MDRTYLPVLLLLGFVALNAVVIVGVSTMILRLRPSPVKNRDMVVAGKSEHPPEAAGEHAVVLIVRDYLHTVLDPESAKGRRHLVR